MKLLAPDATLVELVQDAILAGITSGKLAPGTPIGQEAIALELGVSRGAVQEALAALRARGIVREGAGRSLQVAPLDLEQVRNVYDVRAVLEGLAFRKAAERSAQRAAKEGPALIAAGRKAIERGDIADMIDADIAFHDFIYVLAGNPLLAPAMEAHRTQEERVMGEVLLHDATPGEIWDEHEQMLEAIVAGDAQRVEVLARDHVGRAADYLIERLRPRSPAPD